MRYLASTCEEDEMSELEVDFFFDHLACEVDERAVLSAIYRESGGIVRLQYASLLVGPGEMANGSWGQRLQPGSETTASRVKQLRD